MPRSRSAAGRADARRPARIGPGRATAERTPIDIVQSGITTSGRGYRSSVSARTRMIIVVAALAVVVGGAVAGITAATSDKPSGPAAVGPTVRSGAPPLSLDLGVRTDPEAVDLREALRLYEGGKRTQAERIFARHSSLEARVGEAFSTWPNGTVAGLTQLSGLHPKSAAVQLNLGIARFWAGEPGAEDAWKSAASLEPDTAYAVTAGNLLHPEFARNLPIFVPSTEVPADIRKLSAPAQLALLERRARTGTVTERLFYGVALQRLGKQRSAERVFAAAAKATPNDPEARVAAAVGLFDKARPAQAFSRLGPLARDFPKVATVRFHLGLLLLWSGQVKEARRQLELVEKVEPGSPLVATANRYLAELRKAGI
jgi:tetratricopeptide (TPR) repeat protein